MFPIRSGFVAVVAACGLLAQTVVPGMAGDKIEKAALAQKERKLKEEEQPLLFDEVALVEAKTPNLSLLYVVLTEPNANTGKCVDLVLQYARAALREAAAHKFKGATAGNEKPKYEGNIVFLVRQARGDRRGYLSGFSVEQLREIATAKPDQARSLVASHAWSLGKLPENELAEAKALVIEVEEISRLGPAEQKKKVERVYLHLSPRLHDLDDFALPGNVPGGRVYAPSFAERAKLPAKEWVEKTWQQTEMAPLYLIRGAHRLCQAILGKHPAEIKPLLRADFAGKEETKVKRALRAVGALRAGAYYDQVLAVYLGKNAKLSDQASYTLRALNDPRAIAHFVKKDPQLDCYEQLRSLQCKRKAHPDLVAGLESPAAKVRWHAAYALSESGDPVLAPHVLRLCTDTNALVRQSAANMGFCLEEKAYDKVRPALLKLLSDPDMEVRKFTVACFSQRQDKACAGTLLEMIQDPKRTGQERYDTLTYIRKLTGADFGYDADKDAGQPMNQEAIRRFAEWVKKNAGP